MLAAFRKRFGEPSVVVRSPGRVNLIGEHTDYNQGFVLPAAVDRGITLAMAPAAGRRCVLSSLDMRDEVEADLDDLSPRTCRWPNYLLGVVDQLQKAGYPLAGFALAFGGDLPIGAGMSSSAAVECGIAYGLNELFDLRIERAKLAVLAQAAEHAFVGLQCGIMDQMASLMSRSGHLMLLDCQDLSLRFIPFDAQVKLFLCDSQVDRALADSGYNERRSQCEAAVALLQREIPAIRSLRQVSLDLLEEYRVDMDPVVYRRSRYVIEENARVLAACDALHRRDLAAFGQLLARSHEGLSKDYEVSCPELDVLARTAMTLPGVLGARMMGAGFGGCTINVVEPDCEDSFLRGMAGAFAQIGKHTRIHACAPCAGTARWR